MDPLQSQTKHTRPTSEQVALMSRQPRPTCEDLPSPSQASVLRDSNHVHAGDQRKGIFKGFLCVQLSFVASLWISVMWSLAPALLPCLSFRYLLFQLFYCAPFQLYVRLRNLLNSKITGNSYHEEFTGNWMCLSLRYVSRCCSMKLSEGRVSTSRNSHSEILKSCWQQALSAPLLSAQHQQFHNLCYLQC